jgi:putative tricarboxylic transport membrane protein
MDMKPEVRVWLRAAFAAAVSCAIVTPGHADSAWKPEKAVELIAVNAPSGGGDRILRLMTKVLQERRTMEVPVNVVNKPGGGGSIAYNYLNQHPGDAHYTVLASKSLLTNHISGRGPSYTDFAPLAMLFTEYISVTVRPDSPIRSGKQLVEQLRKDPGSLTIGIATSLGNANHQGIAAPLKAAGVDIRKLRTVIFPSGGAATTAMLGGHIDVVPISAAYAASMARSKQVRVIAVTSPSRLSDVLANVPTWREQGYDVVISNWRGLVAPKGTTDAQIAYWEGVVRRLGESEEWKKELATNFWSADYMRGSDMRAFIQREDGELRAFLGELGLAKTAQSAQ